MVTEAQTSIKESEVTRVTAWVLFPRPLTCATMSEPPKDPTLGVIEWSLRVIVKPVVYIKSTIQPGKPEGR